MGWREEIAKILARRRTPHEPAPAEGAAPAARAPEAGLDVGGGLAGSPGGGESLRQAYLQAVGRAGGRATLRGLPAEAQIVGGQPFIPGPVGRVHDVADQYMAGRDFGVAHPDQFHRLDKARAAAIAKAYDELPLYDPHALP